VLQNGRHEKVADLLLHSTSRPAWNARQRAYLTAVAATPLRLYMVESVIAGYQLTLRPVGVPGAALLLVSERAGSQPNLVGSFLGARVIAHGEQLELAGGIFPFNPLAGMRVSEELRQSVSDGAISRTIRSGWFQQFDQPMPKVVLAGSGEPLWLITDTYRCPAVDVLADRLASDPQVEGGSDMGWSLMVPGEDGRTRSVCSINLDEEAPEKVTVFYQSEGRASRYRPWFESLVGAAVTFVERESLDPYEAAKVPALAAAAQHAPRPPKEAAGAIAAAMYHHLYEDFADRSIPMFDGATPRQMLKQPGGEGRVRELLALYEGNERQLAHQEQREALDLDFLYEKLGLARIAALVMTQGPGMYPEQFAPNDAWIVFRLFDDPMPVKDVACGVAGFGLMDAGSACMLNFHLLPADRDFSEIEARSFFQSLKVTRPSRPPRRLYFGSDVGSAALTGEVSRLNIPVVVVDPLDLDGIVGAAREGFSDRFDAYF